MDTGPIKKTPWLWRMFGAKPYRRATYASWRIGGGFDGWQYLTEVEALQGERQ